MRNQKRLSGARAAFSGPAWPLISAALRIPPSPFSPSVSDCLPRPLAQETNRAWSELPCSDSKCLEERSSSSVGQASVCHWSVQLWPGMQGDLTHSARVVEPGDWLMTDTSTAELTGVCLRSAPVKAPSCLGKRRQLILKDLRMFRRAHSQLHSWKLALLCQSNRDTEGF